MKHLLTILLLFANALRAMELGIPVSENGQQTHERSWVQAIRDMLPIGRYAVGATYQFTECEPDLEAQQAFLMRVPEEYRDTVALSLQNIDPKKHPDIYAQFQTRKRGSPERPKMDALLVMLNENMSETNAHVRQQLTLQR